MAKRFVIPFATSGDKSVTPDATDPGGAISYSQGWPVAYQLPDTDPNYRPVGRQEMNGVLFDVTGALAELQTLGYPEWVAVAGLVTPYAINAVVRHNANNWRNTVANNSVEPGTDNTWVISNEAPPMLTTAGAAPNFALTPSPAIQSYVVGQRWAVKFSATPAGVPTLNVSAKGAKNLKQYDATGTKVQAVIIADQIGDVVYDGTDMVVIDPLPPAQVVDASTTVKGIQRNATVAETQTGASAALTVTPTGLFASVFGMGQTLTTLTGSRALNTNYTNNTGRAIFVTVRAATDGGSASGNRIGIQINGGAEYYGAGTPGAGAGYSLVAVGVVLPGEIYRVNINNANLLDWSERR